MYAKLKIEDLNKVEFPLCATYCIEVRKSGTSKCEESCKDKLKEKPEPKKKRGSKSLATADNSYMKEMSVGPYTLP